MIKKEEENTKLRYITPAIEKDGYSKDWKKEAQKRNLYFKDNIFSLLSELVSEKNIKLFETYEILSKDELNSRFLAWSHLYISNKKIEINVLLELIENKIIPDIIAYRSFLVNDLKLSKDFIEASILKHEKKLLKDYSKLINDLFIQKEELFINKNILKNKNELESINFIYENIYPILLNIKKILDSLEKKTGDKY